MTYGQLKARLVSVSHRTDLTASLPDFVEDARIKLNSRFGLTLAPFVADTDTNTVLTNFPLLYLYASLQALYEHLNNGDNAGYYKGLFDEQCSLQNITANSGATDPYYSSPPVVIPGGTTAGGGTASGGGVSDPLVVNTLSANYALIGGAVNDGTNKLQLLGTQRINAAGFTVPIPTTKPKAIRITGNVASQTIIEINAFHDTNTQGAAILLTRNKAGGSMPSTGNVLGKVLFGALSDGDYLPFTPAQIAAIADQDMSSSAGTGAHLSFSTCTIGTAVATERMRIKDNGTINFTVVATYADNTAALAGGLVAGDVYRTSTGHLMIVF
jgi:hypothetical protein